MRAMGQILGRHRKLYLWLAADLALLAAFWLCRGTGSG